MQPEMVLVDSLEEVDAFRSWLGQRRPVLAVDLETGANDLNRGVDEAPLSPYHGRIRLAQFGDAMTGWAFPYDMWKGVVKWALESYDRPFVAHNAKFDVGFLELDGINVKRELFHDSMTLCHLHDSQGPKALKPAAAMYVGPWAMQGKHELTEAMRKSKWTWDTIPTVFEAYWFYAAMDTVLTARLAETLWPKIQYARDAYELELAVTWVLLDLEKRGIHIDVPYVHKHRDTLAAELDVIESRHPGLNMLSSAQVIDALKREGAVFTRKTAKGNVSLTAESLNEIDHPLARDVVQARWLHKVIGTWFDDALRWQIGGVLHPNINPLGAEKTGRMSVTRPAMQTLPRKSLIRDMIVARPGNRLLLADYSGQEMRVFAHFAGEQAMMAAMLDGVDMHTFTAATVYGVETPSKAQRQIGKGANFAKVYGSGIDTFSSQMGITYAEGDAFLKAYDARFPGVVRFQSKVIRTIHQRKENGRGYVTSMSGRHIKVPVELAYKGVNYLVQGSCSDITKRAMVTADRLGIGEYLVLPVHDELMWDIPADLIEDVEPMVHEAMERDDLRVPLPIDVRIVDRWGDGYREEAA